ncbi:helix-turn-helix transcriptional regulator [uncultured Intestinibacter sp.]
MKINEIIKLKRKELNLTQEQVAEYLGVTTPAVNKWERYLYKYIRHNR